MENSCIVCDTKDNLVSHHLKDRTNFPDLVNIQSNVVTICKTCHVNYHTNWNNSFREQTTEEDFYQFRYAFDKLSKANSLDFGYFVRNRKEQNESD